jgi:hypothetical protein
MFVANRIDGDRCAHGVTRGALSVPIGAAIRAEFARSAERGLND